MSTRQQILYLWMSESALDSEVVAWAHHDGSAGKAPPLPVQDPPYRTGVEALEDGWLLLQAPHVAPELPGREHEIGYLRYEFLFEKRIDVAD